MFPRKKSEKKPRPPTNSMRPACEVYAPNALLASEANMESVRKSALDHSTSVAGGVPQNSQSCWFKTTSRAHLHDSCTDRFLSLPLGPLLPSPSAASLQTLTNFSTYPARASGPLRHNGHCLGQPNLGGRLCRIWRNRGLTWLWNARLE